MVPVIPRINQDIGSFIARIAKKKNCRVALFSRPLETGPADDAGVKGYLVQVGPFQTIALFSIQENQEEPVIEDIKAHAQSAGVCAMVLISSLAERVIFFGRFTEELEWLREISGCPTGLPGDTLRAGLSSPANPSEGIARYLAELRKELNSWLYRRDGETGDSVRELTIQTLINRVLLIRIFLAHQETKENRQDIILRDALCSFASSVPVHDQYDFHTRDPDDETTRVVETLASSRVEALGGIRLSWIEPGHWAAAFTRHIASLPQKPHKKTFSPVPPEAEYRTDALESGAGKLVAEALADKKNQLLSGRILDPACGCGEMIAFVLRLIRVNQGNGDDTIISRLICAGETVHATDASPVHIAATRFVVMSWIFSGEFRDPSLTAVPLWYPLLALDRQIRTGSPLCDNRLLEEFVSYQAGYPVLRNLHPLNIRSLVPGDSPFSLILSCPESQVPGSPPELDSYLTRHFDSYQIGVSQAALFAELATELIAPGGASIIFLRKNWLSEASYQGFRRWIAHTAPITIVTSEEEPGRRELRDMSALVYQPDSHPVHTAIRFTYTNGSRFQVRKYQISPGDNHEDDGWRLRDPMEHKLLLLLREETMPLSEYLFDEIYQGNQDGRICSIHDSWISLICQGPDLSVSQGRLPSPDATIIIPGQDQYLIALLRSSLIRWYLRVTTRGATLSGFDLLNLIKNLPIRVIDHYSAEDHLALEVIEKTSIRVAMLGRKYEMSRSWHDQTRIERQIERTYRDLDNLICLLYGLSSDDCSEIRRRMESFDPPHDRDPDLQIF